MGLLSWFGGAEKVPPPPSKLIRTLLKLLQSPRCISEWVAENPRHGIVQNGLLIPTPNPLASGSGKGGKRRHRFKARVNGEILHLSESRITCRGRCLRIQPGKRSSVVSRDAEGSGDGEGREGRT